LVGALASKLCGCGFESWGREIGSFLPESLGA